MRVGLLGGSFNPAHEGHLHISKDAKRRLDLHQVWWLVSPQNPLKPTYDASMHDRMDQARRLANAPWLQVVSLEQAFGSVQTWQTLKTLKTRFPNVEFVWLMGADNLAQMPRWARWSKIFQLVHIAVFDRSPYSHRVLNGKAAIRFSRYRLQATHGRAFRGGGAKRWVYCSQRRHPASSTDIRLRGKMISAANSD